MLTILAIMSQCRMQVAVGSQFSSPVHCLQLTIRGEGYWGLTRGLGSTMIREVPGNAIFFTVYETLRQALPGRPQEAQGHSGILSLLGDATSAVMCGGLAGTFVGVIFISCCASLENVGG